MLYEGGRRNLPFRGQHFYIGAAPNQQIVPAIEYMNENYGKRFFLLGSDYVFPRTANAIVKKQAEALGMEIVGEEYTPMGHTDYTTILSKIKEADPDFIFNTLNGDSNVAFFKQFKDAGLTPEQIQTCSVSIAEEEVKGIRGLLSGGASGGMELLPDNSYAGKQEICGSIQSGIQGGQSDG